MRRTTNNFTSGNHILAVRHRNVSFTQVLPIWHRVPGGGKDSGHARPSAPWGEAGHVLHHRPVGFVRARPHPAAPLLLLLHSQKSLPLHPRAAAGSGHRAGYVVQVRETRGKIFCTLEASNQDRCFQIDGIYDPIKWLM